MAELTREMFFGTQKKKNINDSKEEVTQNSKDEIKLVDVDKLVFFREGQPFSIHKEEKLLQIKESIMRNGILVPIIIRKIEDNKYEVIDGRHRLICARDLGIPKVPAIEKNADDDNARLIMLETNLCQREEIPPIEKAKAYKLQLETLKKIREKDAVTGGQGYSVEQLANKVQESETNIKRLIRLTELIEPLQDKVNGLEQISIKAGAELSYISKEEQEIINKVLEDNNLKLKVDQAEYLRSIKGTITEESVVEVFKPKPKEKIDKFTGRLNKKTYKKYKEHFNNNEDFDALVDKLLSEYFKKIA